MSGFIALHREAFSHPVLKDADRFRAWFWLVAHAAWKQTRHDARGRTIIVERGQLCAGREQLAKEWKWSPSAVERFLARLETEQMIERETGQGKSVITIRNYDKYQDRAEETGHMSGQQTGQKPDRNRTAKEQGNKGTSDIEANASTSPAARVKPYRMTADWVPGPYPADIAALLALWPPGRLEREVQNTRDYWLDRTEKRPGWDRTLHNRIRDIHDRVLRETNVRPITPNASRPALVDIARGVAADLEREAQARAGF